MRIAVVAGLLLSGLRFGGCAPLDLLDSRSIDFRLLQRGAESVESPVVIVAVDDRSLARIGRWPWPRAKVAELLDRVSAGGPAVVGFDVVQSEATVDWTESLPESMEGIDETTWADVRARLAAKETDEERLARSVAAAGNVVLGYFFDFDSEPRPTEVKLSTYNIVHGTPDGSGEARVQVAPAAVPNLPILNDAAAKTGYFNTFPDTGDGGVRRVPLILRHGERMHAPLSLAMLAAVRPDFPLAVRFREFGVEKISVGPIEIPVDEAGQMLLNLRGPGHTFPHVSAVDILDGKVPPDVFAGQFVLVGVSAAAVADVRVTAFDGIFPGVELHATALDNILTTDFVTQPKWVVLVEIGTILFSVGLLGLVLHRARGVWAAATALLLLAVYLVGSQLYFTSTGVPLGLVYPLLAIVVTYAAIGVLQYVSEEREKRMIRNAFQSYLAPAMVDQVSKDPSKLRLGGEKKELTILFSDIRGFTTISEQFDPEGLTRLINRFLTPMTNAILERKGTIDKYIGDAIMAFWNAPIDDDEHTRNACFAAIALNRLLIPLNEELEAEAEAEGRKHIKLKAGIGVNVGECVVGNMGSDTRFDYSLLGDSVNLAARCESISKQYGASIVISEMTRAKEPDFATLELDLVQVKGKTEPVKIHTLLGEPELASGEPFTALVAAHGQMIERYRAADWDAADAALARCRELEFAGMTVDSDLGLGFLYDLYAERISAFREQPPPEDWDGVFVATQK